MSHDKQFTLFTHIGAPNGWKVAFVLNVLGLTYESRYLELDGDVKSPSHVKSLEHTKYNPNGRIPTLIDHRNNDFALWESGAIILYLLEKYDPEHRLSVVSPDEKAVLIQWLFFQTSGQAPYYGQAAWFIFAHPEKVPSAIERYRNEVRRVLSVLEGVLSDRDYLVGEKLTAADIAFVPYHHVLKERVLAQEDFDFGKEYPRVFAWHSRVVAVEGVKKGLAERLRLLSEDIGKKTQANKA